MAQYKTIKRSDAKSDDHDASNRDMQDQDAFAALALHQERMAAPGNRAYMRASYSRGFLDSYVTGWDIPLEGIESTSETLKADEMSEAERDEEDKSDLAVPRPSKRKRSTTTPSKPSKKAKTREARKDSDDEKSSDSQNAALSAAASGSISSANLQAPSWDEYEKLVALQVRRDNPDKTFSVQTGLFNQAIANTTRPDGSSRQSRSYQSFRQCLAKLRHKGITAETMETGISGYHDTEQGEEENGDEGEGGDEAGGAEAGLR